MLAVVGVLFNRGTVLVVEGTYWSSKCRITGPRNVLKIGGLTKHIKGLSGYAAGR